jgi:dynein heavy chain 1
VDNVIDDNLLKAFVHKVFVADVFARGFQLVAPSADGTPGITAPAGETRAQLLDWINESLPDKEQPSWIGLPNSAQRVLKHNLGVRMVNSVLAIQASDDVAPNMEAKHDDDVAAKPGWMGTVATLVTGWLDRIPAALAGLDMTEESIKDPLFRYFSREIDVAATLVKLVRSDCEAILAVTNGEAKLTNNINVLKNALTKGVVPPQWRKYTIPGTVSTVLWVADFVLRAKQYQQIVAHVEAGSNLRTFKLWLGGVMEPAAYFTASRQAVAQSLGVSLEELRMELSVPSSLSPALDATQFHLVDLRFEGAEAKGNVVSIMEMMHRTEACVVLQWCTGDARYSAAEQIALPIYLNGQREGVLIDTVDFQSARGLNQGIFYERGAAVICSALGGV